MAGLYIHIPFCHSKCAYCDFYSMPGQDGLYVRVAHALLNEYRLRRCECADSDNWRTVYIGGGTPSIIDPDYMGPLLDLVTAGASEITLEVNPEDVRPDNMSCWRSLGINRVSMGVQSMIDSELVAVGRRHDAQRAAAAFKTLRDVGFDNISLDIIYGLPGQTFETFAYSLAVLLDMSPEHFSAYCLSYEPGTRLYAAMMSGRLEPTDDEILARMYEHLHAQALAHGYDHYEISNFGKPGCHSMHNSSYWDSTPYLGLGPGAHSYDGSVRRYNPSDLRGWLGAIESGRVAAIVESETETERQNDIIFTRLRTERGLNPDELSPRYRDGFIKRVRRLPEGTVICRDDGTFSLPHSKWLVSDAIIRELLAD